VVADADRETVVSMKANHPNRPLEIEDRVRFEHGTGIIKHEVWATNTNSESETFQLRLVGRGGGINFNEGTMYIPLASGVMKEKLGNMYTIHPAIPSEPSTYSEGWIATEQEGAITGQVWDNSKVEEVRLGNGQMGLISFPQTTLEPGETRRLSQLWLVCGVHGWADVRRIWQSRVVGYHEGSVDYFKSEEPTRLVNLNVNPIAIPHLQEAEGSISLSKSTVVPLNGTLRYTPPKGWSASIIPTNLEIQNMKEGKEASGEILFTHDTSFKLKHIPGPKVLDEFAIHRGLIEFNTDWSMKQSVSLIQLGSSTGKVEVLEDVDQGLKVHTVNNGLIEYTVSADFGGCLISLKNDKGVEYLDNSFPNPAPKPGGFFDNYYGGIQPIVFDDEMGEDFDKARTNKEKMSGNLYETGYWKGVEVSWRGKLQKLTRGVDFKLRYLTTAKSPLVLIQWVITNRNNAPMKFWPTFLIDPNLTKELTGGSYQTEWDNETVELRKGMIPVAVTPTRNIAWMKPKPGTKKTSGFGFMIAGYESRMLVATLGDMMILGGVNGLTWLMPGEEKIISAGLLVDPKNMDDIRKLQEILDKI
jgi:hypothetical protein